MAFVLVTLACKLRVAGADLGVELAAGGRELFALLLHAFLEGGLGRDALLGGHLAHVLGDLHRAEVRTAHRAEVRRLGGRRRQGLVVELTRGDRVHREVELILPAELEAGATHGVVPLAGARVTLGHVGGVGRDAVGDHPVLDVLAVRQAEVLLRRHVAQHGRAHRADVGGTDGAGDVIITYLKGSVPFN